MSMFGTALRNRLKVEAQRNASERIFVCLSAFSSPAAPARAAVDIEISGVLFLMSQTARIQTKRSPKARWTRPVREEADERK
jgi:hypothetical protein